MMSLSVASPPSLTFAPARNLSKSLFHGVRIAHVCPVSSLRTSHSSSSSLVVRMAKKEEELKEIRAKTTEEIKEEILNLKGELLMLRLQTSVRNEFKSSEFGRMRKRVARMMTVKRERELEEGINKRLSRKLDRKWMKSVVPKPPPSLLKLQEEAEEEAKKSSA
nr:50S ribosomal protein L29, chloroplastic-like [Ipomoea batatas]GMD63676.1 50S ribosomal protein L29, chloroplastic-like [Ipomoea batatas]GMD66367.1 50S ribosomal protein L29, chloroplastic-like [Ipomoea batatas]GME05219.1 50S ribosomal protein L29, chloroplastic-like [Ipomoea batatas]